jgi:hypothetical protein
MEGSAMRAAWAAGLSLLIVAGTQAEEWQGRPANLSSAVTLGRPLPVTLGRPYAMEPAPIIRAQAPDFAPPAPTPVQPAPSAPVPPGPVGPPPGVAGVPATPDERYNCGVVTDNPPPAGSHPLLGGLKNFCQGCTGALGHLGLSDQPSTGRARFQSDHGFDNLISPVSNPFLFEDPRSLTEVRPLFMYQGTPGSNYIFRGGDIEFAGLQARLALTERLSLVMSELGFVWIEPHNSGGEFFDHVGFTEIRIGPKYTFYRCEERGSVAAAGLNFDIPAGSGKVFQDTGTLSLEPYISAAKNFGRTSFGSFNTMGTIGYSAATDNQRSDFLFTSLHLDFDVANAHKIYPFLELNYFYYTQAGKARDIGFEGRDLFNFGSMGVSGNNEIAMAVGARYKFNECFQTGLAAEFPVSSHHDVMDFRLTVDFIFRF